MCNNTETWYCPDCGCRDIRHDAIAQYDREQDSWRVLSLLDNSWCESCTMRSEPLARSGAPIFGIPPELRQEH